MLHAYVYVHDLRSSGVVRNALTYAGRIAQDRPTTLVAGFGEGFFADELSRASGYRHKLLGRRPGPAARFVAAQRLRRWLKRQPPGAVLSIGNMGHATPFLAGRGLPQFPRIYCISNEVARSGGWRDRWRLAWMNALVHDSARVVLVGRTIKQVPLFAEAMARGKAVELPNGIDLDRARRLAAEPVPHPWLEDPEVPVAIGIGRLRPQKNFDLLIDAVGQARAARRLRLIILGGGTAEERERLQSCAAAAGLGADFLLAGETDNVFAWLSRASVFALPSRWEGSSLALLEALAVGTPVVASRRAGDAADVLDHGRYGLLVDGESADELADALLRQCSADVVRPGDRSLAFDDNAGAYASLIAELDRAGAVTR